MDHGLSYHSDSRNFAQSLLTARYNARALGNHKNQMGSQSLL